MKRVLEPVDQGRAAHEVATISETVRAYVELTKPGILRLLLITMACAMLVAARGLPNLWTMVWAMVGMTLVSASANAMNMVYDEDIDGVMHRTMHRPIPSGRVDARGALIFAAVIGIVGVVVLHVLVNPVASIAALSGHLFYVFIYTMWLKRSTPQNIVIGGAAGAVPPLVGWAAVQGDLSLAAWIMFAIIFFWTPPHFWALALYKRLDYSRAGVPMLPVVSGEAVTKRQIMLYTVLLMPVTVSLAFAGMGIIYLVAAIVLGLMFCFCSAKILTTEGDLWPKRTFAYSIIYLGLLFGAMSLDSLLVEPLLTPAGPILEIVPVVSTALDPLAALGATP